MLEAVSPAVDPVEHLLTEGNMRPGDLLRALFESANDFVGVLSLDYKIVTINHTRPGVDFSDVIGASLFSFLRPEVHASVRHTLERVRATGRPLVVESPTSETAAGGPGFYESRISPVRHGNEIVGFVFIATDVSEARRREAATRESEATLRLVLSAAKMGIWSWRSSPVASTVIKRCVTCTGSRPGTVRTISGATSSSFTPTISIR
ncbi:MAG: PAS domain-containing protein [Polyangiaceae bacterium]